MNDRSDKRPDPDALLKAAKKEARGRLKILLGAAPGVGKTYEMLSEGARMQRAGRDVVAGIVETHGRAETAALITPLEVLPRRQIEHGAHKLTEFDIDAMLARHPQVALIDELAHTNAPGSRHPKRWQDVEELRDAGIDVVATLNIQHVESLNDVVASFTRVRVRETVPDSILDDADIEVIDLPPDELILRLTEGKVYVPEEASRALNHFFSKANLSALRELALRRAAQTVDRQMLDQIALSGEAGNWAAGERIAVAVNDQPGGQALVRAAKRLADSLRAQWTAVTVETPRSANVGAEGKARLAGALKLAAELGATLVTIPAANVADGLRDYLSETKATILVIGKARRSRWFELRHGSVVDRLVRTLPGLALHVLPLNEAPAEHERVPGRWSKVGLVFGLVMVLAATGLNLLIEPYIGINSIDLIYLLPVMATGSLFGMRPAMVSAVAAALAYNFFFLPPTYTLTISDPNNIIAFIMLAGVGAIASQFSGRLRSEANIGARTAMENAALATFGQRLGAVSDMAGSAAAICEEVGRLLDVSAALLVPESEGARLLAGWPDLPVFTPIDHAAADWALGKSETTGRASATLNAADWQFWPLRTAHGVQGVLAVANDAQTDPVPPDRRVLFTTMIGQSALALERLKLESESRGLMALKQRDELRATLLSSLGHDLKTPLTAVVAAAEALADESGGSRTAQLLITEAMRLRRLFDDLVEMTRLETGGQVARPEAIDLTEAVAAAAHSLTTELAPHPLRVDISPGLPLVEADARMLHHILVNLLDNAAKFTPAGGAILVSGRRVPGGLELEVADEGRGLPSGQEARLFERFVRVEGSDQTGGTGLGLAIVKGFADAMGLGVSARNREGAAGACFIVVWPERLLRRAVPEGESGGQQP